MILSGLRQPRLVPRRISAQKDAVRDVQAQLSATESQRRKGDTEQFRKQLVNLTQRLQYHMDLVVSNTQQLTVEKQLLVELYKAKTQGRQHLLLK